MNIKNIAALAFATVVAVPAFAAGYDSPEAPAGVAAQPAGLTRAQVRAELVALENAGYDRRGDHANYPTNIQAAEARVAAQSEVTGSYGGVAGDVSASGAPTAARSEATGD
ncbi:MAG: DUF4148 domain-containing protein [Paraburkholderia sp.]